MLLFTPISFVAVLHMTEIALWSSAQGLLMGGFVVI